MLYLLMFLLPLIVLFRIWNQSRVTNVKIHALNELEKLRFELRLLCVDGKVNPKNSKIFSYLDYSISNSEHILVRASFWLILYTSIRNRKDELIPIQKIKDLESYLQEKEPELKKVFDSYIQVTYDYFNMKSIFSIVVTGIMMQLGRKIAMVVVKCRNMLRYHLVAFQFPAMSPTIEVPVDKRPIHKSHAY